jgi:hypothetical protein
VPVDSLAGAQGQPDSLAGTQGLSSEQVAKIEENRREALARKNLKEAQDADNKRAKWSCIICCDEMSKDDERLALPCGHTFHKECVTKYAKLKEIPLEKACPMRCSRSSAVAITIMEAEKDADSLL